jgi:hypothetical protein
MIRLLFLILFVGLFTPSFTQDQSNDTSNIAYKVNAVLQYGGESKITLLPKFNLLRVHRFDGLNPYYGIELGVVPLFVAGAFTSSIIGGVELRQFRLESSISYFRTTKSRNADQALTGPFAESLFNLKIGYTIQFVTLKLGTSFLIAQNQAVQDQGIPLFDIAYINGQLFGIELQFSMF